MKILYVTTVGGTMKFFTELIKELVAQGNVVDIAANENNGDTPVPSYYKELGCRVIPLHCSRSPLSKGNSVAVHEIRRLVKEGGYDIVHCHTPIASVCTRLACRKANRDNTKVVYTAHGFHFYKGAPKKNWLVFYPIEKICSKWTDYLITINREDYDFAKCHFKHPEVIYVPGVGVETQRYMKNDLGREKIRKELRLEKDDVLIVSVGELNENKNHRVILEALALCNNNRIHYAIAGRGKLADQLNLLGQTLGISLQVHILGYRNDVPALYSAADICAFPSIREGQGIAAIEAMASSLPIITSDNRGMRGILVNQRNAFVCDYNDASMFSKAISILASDPLLRSKMGALNRELSMQFDVKTINKQMKDIYSSIIK